MVFSNSTSTHLVWFQRCQLYRNIQMTTIKWSFEPSMWPWLWPKQSNVYTRHSSLWSCSSQVHIGCKRISSSVHTVQSVIPDCMSPHCYLNRKDRKPIFSHNTLAHDDESHTTFSYKRFSTPEDIIRTNTELWTLMWHWPWTQQSIFFTRHSGVRWCTIILNVVGKDSVVRQN